MADLDHLEREDRDSWLTVQDLIWRPDCYETRFAWSDLKRLRNRWLDIRKHLVRCIKRRNQSPSERGRRMLDDIERDIHEAYEQLMYAAYTELGWIEKPTSVRFCEWLMRQHLPTLRLRWKRELWYRMLEWEFRAWLSRIHERSGVGHAKTVNTLMRKLPQWRPDRYGDPIWLDTQARAEVTIAGRWLLLRGRYLKEQEWRVFSEILHTSPDLIL